MRSSRYLVKKEQKHSEGEAERSRNTVQKVQKPSARNADTKCGEIHTVQEEQTPSATGAGKQCRSRHST